MVDFDHKGRRVVREFDGISEDLEGLFVKHKIEQGTTVHVFLKDRIASLEREHGHFLGNTGLRYSLCVAPGNNNSKKGFSFFGPWVDHGTIYDEGDGILRRTIEYLQGKGYRCEQGRTVKVRV
jgi:hypothetical protein